MEMNKKELLEKAKTAKTVEELIALATENGIALTAEKAKEYFAELHAKACELEDDVLDNVSGGALPIFDKKVVRVDVSAEAPVLPNKEE